jgi:hypothetical protein
MAKKRYFYQVGYATIGVPDGADLAQTEWFAKHDISPKTPAIIFEQSGRNPPEPVCIWERSA